MLTNMLMEIIFILLSIFIIAFFITICLTLFKVERSVKTALRFAEKKILKVYGANKDE